jgi:hypothetical protein
MGVEAVYHKGHRAPTLGASLHLGMRQWLPTALTCLLCRVAQWLAHHSGYG